MGLIGNYNVFQKNPGRSLSGTSSCDRVESNKSGASRCFYYTDMSNVPNTTSITTHPLFVYARQVGYRPPYTWNISQKEGGMSMSNYSYSTSTIALIPAYPMSIDLTGSGTLTATGLLTILMVAALSGTSSISAAITGQLNMSSSITGTGSLTAGITALGEMVASLTGSGSLTTAVSATADMSIDITVTGTGLSTANVGAAVWAALAASNNDPGSMGEIMNNMGAAADPWTTTLPGAYASGTAGDIIGNLLANIPSSVWDELKTTHTTDDTYGKIVQDLETLAKQIKALTAANL